MGPPYLETPCDVPTPNRFSWLNMEDDNNYKLRNNP
jgi:hypothetical protein